MTTKSSFITAKAFPLDKSDIHYNPASEEISIKREKFDSFVKYVRELQEKLEAAEDARDVAQYRARKEGKTADVLQALTESVAQSTAAVRNWLAADHTVHELSKKTGIPYATCHRIVKERLGTPDMAVGHIETMVAAIAKGHVAATVHPGFERVLLGLRKGFKANDLISPWLMQGSEVSTVHAGTELAEKAEELNPNLVLVDIRMPNLKNGLEELKQIAKNNSNVMIMLTADMAHARSFLERSFQGKQEAEEAASEGEVAGG